VAVVGAVDAPAPLAAVADDPPAVQAETPTVISRTASEIGASVALRRTDMGSILPHRVD
jgi:hypothetical protein